MTVEELKQRVDFMVSQGRGDWDVCIPNNKGGWGGTSVTMVKSANGGSDWNRGKFFINPEVKMIEAKNS